jgi:hypothetical protein
MARVHVKRSIPFDNFRVLKSRMWVNKDGDAVVEDDLDKGFIRRTTFYGKTAKVKKVEMILHKDVPDLFLSIEFTKSGKILREYRNQIFKAVLGTLKTGKFDVV